MQSDAAPSPGPGKEHPELLPPVAIAPKAALAGGAVVAAVALGALWLATRGDTTGPTEPAAPPPTIALDLEAYPLRFVEMPFDNVPGPVRDALALPEQEKRELEAAIAAGTTEIGIVTLWDNVEEDGDTIIVEGAGFTQTLIILHAPKTYYVPYRPGATIRITAIRDGGGGITLGAAGRFGDLALPPLVEGQVMEIPVL